MWGLLAGAWLAGLVGSPHCVAMCGGFASGCAAPGTRATAYHLGRLSTYALLGALAGSLGWALPGPTWVLTVASGLLTAWFAASLAGLVHAPKLALPGLTQTAMGALRQGGPWGAYLFGAATALLPCGLVYAALGVPVALAHPGWGALAMVAFGSGTVPLLAAASVGLRRIVASRLWARRLLGLVVLLSGWWSIAMRHQLTPPAPTEVASPDGR